MKHLFCALLGAFLVLSSLSAQSPANLHRGLDSLLQKHVSATGQVNYKGLKADKAALDAYLQVLSDNVPVDSTSRADQMAYWINAYNAFTLDLIVRNYPTTSILRFDNGKTWDVKRIALGKRKYSLNQIENEILRPQFKDPRIHFAINCAAQSCPPLWNHAFTADNLDSALETRTRAFVNDRQFNTLKKQSLSLSKIFDWYAADFGNIQQFINRYAETKVSKSATVTFNEYNWDLNDVK